MSDPKTYTEDEYNTVVAQVSALEAKVAEMAAANEASDIDAKVAAAKAEGAAAVAALQTELDTKTVEAEAAKSEHAALVALLEETERIATEAAAFEARKSERAALVKEASPFLTDEYISENAERFASMEEAAFTASLDAIKAATDAAGTPAPKGEIPKGTAMTAARTTTESESNPLRDVFALRGLGVDTRTVN